MRTKFGHYLTFIFVLVMQIGLAQNQKTVSGTITDESGAPLPGVNITIEGSTTGTNTDFDGEYSIDVEEGQTLNFSSVGFEDQSIVVGDDNTIDIQLSEGTALDEVVVVGYGKTTKQSFTGSIVSKKGEELSKKNVSNIADALEGEVAGVNVINTSGQPGEEPKIRVRGFGSVNGNRDPLIVVDGVPFNGKLNSINPNDIETVNVLKDATATAIYGSRGSNGVIVVETKKGKTGESTITASYKIGQNFRLLPEYKTIDSPEEYVALGWEGFRNRGAITGESNPEEFANDNIFSASGIDPRYNIWDIDNVEDLIDPSTGQPKSGVSRLYDPEDWNDYAFQSSVRSEGNLEFSGGADKTTYYASFGYLNDKGYSINSDYNRYTMRANINQGITDWLDGDLNLGYTTSKSNQNGQSEDSNSVFWFTDNLPPIYPLFLRDEDGNKVDDPIYGGHQYDYGDGRGFGALTNAVADAIYNLDRDKMHEVNASNHFTAKLFDGLTAETNLGLQYRMVNHDGLTNPFYGSAASSNGSISKTKREYFSYNFSQILRYNKKFDEHSIEAFAAHEINSWERNYMGTYKNDLVIPDLPEFNNAAVQNPANSYKRAYTLESYFGQINYDYDNRYFLSGTIRRDGSSRFKKGNKWGTFGSIGAGWDIARENFIDNADWLETLKLRASYGLTGEQEGVGLYPASDLFEVNNLNDEISLSFKEKGNPDLTWETSEMFTLGLDFQLGSFLEGSFDYYFKNTKDQLFERRMPTSIGYSIINVNDGTLQNSGFEFDIIGHILKGDDYFLDINLNGEFVKNKMTKMPIDPTTGDPKVLDASGAFGRAEGHGIYDYYLREWAGVDSETGEAMWNRYYDTDTDETITNMEEYVSKNPDANIESETTTDYQDATRKFVGKSAIPDVQGGINIQAGLKNFSLTVQLNYGIGGYGYDSQYADLMDDDLPGSNAMHVDMLDRWQEGGDITDVPRLSAAYDLNDNNTSTRFLTSRSYLNLNNIRLGYSIPESILDGIGIGMSNMDVYVSGTNLALLSKRKGFNPTSTENGSSGRYIYNPLSTFTAGVSVTF